MNTDFSELEKTRRYSCAIGNYALIWGSFEATVRRAIPRIEASFEEAPYSDSLSRRLPELNGKLFFQLLSELRSTVQADFKETPVEWKEFFDDAERIKRFRNTLMHNYFYIDDGVLCKAAKPKRGELDLGEIRIPLDTLEKELALLEDRYRQLFDSVIERDETWILRFPKLPSPEDSSIRSVND